MPESIYEQFRAVAEGMTYIEYDYNQHAYLRWKQKGYEEKMGNILSTTWTQESGFNVALPQISGQYPPAGCATIAMAQVMKYNEYPTFLIGIQCQIVMPLLSLLHLSEMLQMQLTQIMH